MYAIYVTDHLFIWVWMW